MERRTHRIGRRAKPNRRVATKGKRRSLHGQREEVLKLAAESSAALEKQHHIDEGQEANPSTLDPRHVTVEKPERGRGASAPALARRPVRGCSCASLPRPAAERWRHERRALVQRVRESAQNYSDDEIAAKLNAEGLKSNKGNAFTRSPAFPGFGTSTVFHRSIRKSRKNRR